MNLGDGILDDLLQRIEAGRRMSREERRELQERRDRWRRWSKTTVAWLAKSVHLATGGFGHEDRSYVLAYEYEQLLVAVIDAADDLVRHAPDDAELAERLRPEVERTAKRLRDIVQANKLAGTAGRSPEEAAEFAARAEKLRARARAWRPEAE